MQIGERVGGTRVRGAADQFREGRVEFCGARVASLRGAPAAVGMERRAARSASRVQMITGKGRHRGYCAGRGYGGRHRDQSQSHPTKRHPLSLVAHLIWRSVDHRIPAVSNIDINSHLLRVNQVPCHKSPTHQRGVL
jgi:hypothetical protein